VTSLTRTYSGSESFSQANYPSLAALSRCGGATRAALAPTTAGSVRAPRSVASEPGGPSSPRATLVSGALTGHEREMPTPRLMVVLFVAIGLVVAAVLALTLQSWWVLAGVLVLHAIATTFVVGYTLRRTLETGDKPDPVREARIEEDRVEQRRAARS